MKKTKMKKQTHCCAILEPKSVKNAQQIKGWGKARKRKNG